MNSKKTIFLVELSFRLHAQYPLVIEFDIYPIDIYRQKTDDHFIGTLNIYQIDTQNSAIGSTNSTLVSGINRELINKIKFQILKIINHSVQKNRFILELNFYIYFKS